MKNRFIKGVNDNVLFVTSRCTNRCIMCCQPPTLVDDASDLYYKNIRLIDTADIDTDYVCITGGEPTIIGDLLFEYVKRIKKRMPNCCVHLLTNGRLFSRDNYLVNFSQILPENILIGIPLHSDNYIDHDFIAGSKNAFYETTKGLHNLGIMGYEVEIRIILLKQNVDRLPQIADFILHNFPFAGQVSFMGLEITGNAEKNYNNIWLDPQHYEEKLRVATKILSEGNIQVKIFNIPLCLLNYELWNYSCKSISNWKKVNANECTKCKLLNTCCGLFSTSKVQSLQIHHLR